MGRSNWFAGVHEGGGDGSGWFRTDCGLLLEVPADARAPGPWHLCLRPESIDMLPAGVAPGPNHLPVLVTDVVLLGAARQVTVRLAGGQPLLVLQPNRAALHPVRGQTMLAAFPPAACILLADEPA